jgi:hypothetical protein
MMFRSPIDIFSFFSFGASLNEADEGFLDDPKSDAAALDFVTFEAAVGEAGSAADFPIEGRNLPRAESNFNGLVDDIVTAEYPV